MAEWLRRVIRNHMGYARLGSNPSAVDWNQNSESPLVQLVRILGFHPKDPGSNPGGRRMDTMCLCSSVVRASAL